MLSTVEKRLRQLAQAVAIAGGAGLLFAIAATCVSIAGKLCRRALDALGLHEWALTAHIGPILGEEEMVQYAVGLALFAALPWLTLERGHIRVDLFQRLLSERVNRALILAGDILLAAVAYLILTRQWFLIFKKTRRGQDTLPELLASGDWTSKAGVVGRMRWHDESQILGVKLVPIYAIAEICILLLLIVCLFNMAKSAARCLGWHV